MVFQASFTDVSPFLNVKRTGTPSWGYLPNPEDRKFVVVYSKKKDKTEEVEHLELIAKNKHISVRELKSYMEM